MTIDFEKYDLVEVLDSGTILLQEKQLTSPALTELGSTGMTSYGTVFRQEYNSQLRGQAGRLTYNKMRKSDGQIRAILRLIKTPVLAARWYVSPASDSRKDQKIAQFVEDCLFKYMSTSFPQLMTEILTMLDFGFSTFEKVYKIEDVGGKQRVVWKKLAQRHALDIYQWRYDENGGPSELSIFDPNAAGSSYLNIPMERLLAFVFEKEGGDMEGVSVLRPAYKHWYYKENLYKVDAIQKERHGVGIPVIKLPVGFQDEDKRLADELGRNIRTNEKAHIVLPPNWEISMLKLEGQPVNAMESIAYHDKAIARSILGQFINFEQATGQQEQVQTLFLKATRYIAETIRDVFNKWAIPELVAFNFPNVEEFPELRVRRIGDTMDWRTVSFAIRNFIGAGVIVPDDRLETWIRDEMDLPPVEELTKRIIVAPLNQGTIPDGQPDGQPGPGNAATGLSHMNGGAGSNVQAPNAAGATIPKAKLPGQSAAGNMKKTPGANGRVGVDQSGKAK
jgi:hypothetical protein